MAGSDNRNPLLEAVQALTQQRTVRTIQLADDGQHVRTHAEPHPSLLMLLAHGTGISRGARSSELRIPIDAEKLELLAQIRDTIRTWSRELGVEWRDGADWAEQLVDAVVRWHGAHHWAVRDGRISDEAAQYTLRTVQGWVQAIERKYDPAEVREWTEACPAVIGEGLEAYRCHARRIEVAGTIRFAIQVNVTTMSAECAACGTRWIGAGGLAELRYLTNLWQLEAEMDAERAEAALATTGYTEASTGPIGVLA